MSDNQIVEKASDHVGGGATGASYAADPTGASATLPASNLNNGEKTAKGQGDAEKQTPTMGGNDSAEANKKTIATKPSAASSSMKEQIEEIFGSDISEEFKEKATVIFEAAVAAKVADIKESFESEKAALETQYQDTFAKQKEELLAEMTEQVDSYIDYVVQEWVKENQVAIDNSLRADIAENFMTKLRDLFVESYIDIPEEKVDVVAEMASKLEELESKLNDTIAENINLKATIAESEKDVIFNQVSEGLAMTQVEKFRKLAEGVDYDEQENYRKKLEIVKEQYFGEKVIAAKTIEEQEIVELDEETTAAPKLAGPIANYVTAISRTLKKV